MFKNLLSKVGWGDLPSSFGFAVGEKVELPYRWHWHLHEGKKKSDGGAVSIFVCPKQDLDMQQSMAAKNAVQMAKSLRHTQIVKALDSIEVDSGYYLVTEHVRPLLLPDAAEADDGEPAVWGLYQLFEALGFLHQSGFTHGLFGPACVLVTDRGDYRLGCFDLCRKDADAAAILAQWRRIGPGVQGWPEPPGHLQNGGGPTSGVDLWGAAVLIAFVYAAARSSAKGADVRLDMARALQDLPAGLKKPFSELLEPKPLRGRNPMVDLLGSPVFQENGAVCVMSFLGNVHIKSQAEKDSFFDNLPSMLENVPVSVQTRQVLPQLLEAQKFAGQEAAQVLPSILKIGTRLKEDDFKAQVAPLVCQLFASPDRAVRFRLLSSLGDMIDNLDTQMINDKIFPECVNGFTDSNAPIREATVKSMIFFIPKLNPKIVENRVVKLLIKLMQDPESSIRTNCVICTGRISGSLPKAVASQTLMTVLSCGFKDPFPHCRSAALQTVAATCSLFSPEELAQRLMPGVCQRLVDPEPSVCAAAQTVLSQLAQQVQEAVEEQRAAVGEQQGVPGAIGGAAAPAAAAAQAAGGWGSWALSTVGTAVGQKIMGSMGPPKADSGIVSPPASSPRIDEQPVAASEQQPVAPAPRPPQVRTAMVWSGDDDDDGAIPGDAWGDWGDLGEVVAAKQSAGSAAGTVGQRLSGPTSHGGARPGSGMSLGRAPGPAVGVGAAAPVSGPAAKPMAARPKAQAPDMNKEEDDFWKEFDM